MNKALFKQIEINEDTIPIITQLAESIPGGFFVYHADGEETLIFFNSRMPAMFGCESDEEFRELTGNSFKGIVHPEDYARCEGEINEQIASSAERLDHVRYRFFRKDGSIGVMDDYGHFSHSESFGDIFYVFVQDITEQIEQEQRFKEELAANYTRILALEDDFEMLFDVDLETGEYESYNKKRSFSEKISSKMAGSGDFFADTVKNTDTLVYPEDREGFRRVTGREYICRELATTNHIDWHYRLVIDSRPVWFRMRIVYKDEKKRNIIFGIFNAEAEVAVKKQLEQERKELIAQMGGSESLYIVNPVTEQFQVLRQNEYLAGEYTADETFTKSIQRYINTDVFEPDRKMAAEAMSTAAIVKNLENDKEYLVPYRDNSSGLPYWYRMRAVRLSETELLIGFENYDTGHSMSKFYKTLEEDYFALFVADIDAKVIKVVKKSQWYVTVTVGQVVAYSMFLNNLAANFVGETKAFFERLADYRFVRRELATANKIACTYKSPLIEGGRWVRVECLVLSRHEDGMPLDFAIGFRLLDALGSEKQELQAELGEALKAVQVEKNRYDILHELIHSGQWSFRINAADEIVSAYYAPEGVRLVNNDLPQEPAAWVKLIHPDDKAAVLASFRAAIDDHSGQTTFDATYRMIDRNGKYNWFRSAGRVLRQEDGSGEFFGIHVDISDRINEEREQQEKLRQAEEVRGIIDRFVKNNKATFIVNWALDSYRLIRPRQEDYDTFGSDPSFTRTFQGYAGRIYEADRELLKAAFNLKTIRKRLKAEPNYSVRYRGLSREYTSWYELRFSKLSTELFILAIADVTEAAAKELAQNAISRNSYSIFLVDLFTNTARMVKRSEKFRAYNGRDVFRFTEAQGSYIRLLDKKYQAEWQGLDTIAGLKRFLKDEDKRELVYESPYHEKRRVRCTWQVIERLNGEASTICISFAALDDEQADREKLHEQIAQQLETIGGVASEYTSLYHVNLLTGQYKPYTIAAKIADILPVIARNPKLGDMLNEFFASDLVLPEYRERLRAFYPSEEGVRLALADKKKLSVIFERNYGGEILWTEGNIIKCENINEPARMAVVGFKEVDEEVRTRIEQKEKLEAALKSAEVANNSKTSFLFNMSHDIRTPMNAIKGFTTMAQKYLDDKERANDYLNKIHVSGRQLLNLINQVLEMSRIESGKIELDNQPVNIREKYEPFVTIFAEQAKEKGIDFHYSLSDIRHYQVLADELRMGQITFNIVGNALKYTPEGGRVDFLLKEVPCEREGWGRYTLTVADTGIGMSKEYLKVLFEPFTREQSSTVSHIQGTGLGMSIVKHLVDLIGGTIEVQSELGKGTRFDITVDMQVVEESGQVAKTEPEEEKEVNIESVKGKRVLLVEDNELNREIAKDILEEFGLIVEEAEDGDVAVDMVRTAYECGEFDYYKLVLMDIQMPKMNGYEATQAIRKLPVPEDIRLPIVAMTANAFEEDRRNAFAAGMDDHLAKPIDIGKLMETLARFL